MFIDSSNSVNNEIYLNNVKDYTQVPDPSRINVFSSVKKGDLESAGYDILLLHSKTSKNLQENWFQSEVLIDIKTISEQKITGFKMYCVYNF